MAVEKSTEAFSFSAGGSFWTPYKQLYDTVSNAVLQKNSDVIPDLDVCLKKHKPAFINLLRNPEKNSIYRDAVKAASSAGISVLGQQGKHVFPQQVVDESLILSDMFDLNELAALELLITGEQQLSQLPGLTRGLVAVLLYYDGRRGLVNSLRTLLQGRDGSTWSLNLSDELAAMITKYTDELIEENVVSTILEQLKSYDISKEIELLQKHRALGSPKHRKQVLDLMNETRQSLADCIFCIACQSNMSENNTLAVIDYLSKVKEENMTKMSSSDTADSYTLNNHTVDKVTVTLLMAVLYSIDVSILQTTEDCDELLQNLTLIKDSNFIPRLHKELVVNVARWQSPALRTCIQLAWAITLRTLSQYPYLQDISRFVEEDENIVDNAVDNNVFSSLSSIVSKCEGFHKEEFYLKRIHNLITDFLTLMPLKVKELRNRGDETARIIMAHMQEGLQPPRDLPTYFHDLLTLIANVYAKDPLKLELATDYWYSSEPVINVGMTSTYSYGNPQKQVVLFKFLRVSGDLLPASLYIPHVHMLTSLASATSHTAHLCYNLLKMNGSTPGDKYSTVSWDHFFLTLHRYYSNLRQETPISSDTQHIYRHRPSTKGITPQEMDALMAVLELIRVVAEKDEMARIALCENRQYLPVGVIIGLTSCSIPPHLKGQLLRTLSALAHTPDIAENIWQALEASEVIQTTKSTAVYQPSGIQIELNEIEARNEEYPLTRGMLKLLHVLITCSPSSIPTLGLGYRAPGFDPYLEFLRNDVFLKFNTRAYKDPAEKWLVAKDCLEVFHHLLEQHEITADQFTERKATDIHGGGTAIANNFPGHNIMLHMLHNGNFLKMVFFIVDEATNLLNQFVEFPGKTELESSALLCLKLLQLILDKQTVFMSMLREHTSGVIVNSMNKLLLGINQRTGYADHLTNVIKFVTFNAYLPEHTLTAVKILMSACQDVVIQTQIVEIFRTNHKNLSASFLQGLVECIDITDVEISTSIDSDDDTKVFDASVDETAIRTNTRQHILRLLLTTLNHPAPNLAHFLLGFLINKPVQKTNLQDPGVLGVPRTCFHAILYLLDNSFSTNGKLQLNPIHVQSPVFTDLVYQLIYRLCVNKDTSTPTLRYLRTTHDFFHENLRYVPFTSSTVDSHHCRKYLLSQQSWFLKSVAMELRLTAVNRQRSHVQRLLSLLVDDRAADVRHSGIASNIDTNRFDSDAAKASNLTAVGLSSSTERGFASGQVRRKLLSILDELEFIQEYSESPQWEYFDSAMIEQVFKMCEEQDPTSSVKIVNIPELHHILITELSQIQGAAAIGQRPLVIEEIQKILKYVMERNNIREAIIAKKQAFEAWRQITEIILTSCPVDLLDGEKRQNVLFEIIQELLKKILDDSTLTELTNPVAGVILILLTNLRQSFLSQNVNPGDDRIGAVKNRHQLSSHSVYSSFLQVTLKGLIECIMKSSGGQQRVRANFYAALLNYLRIGDRTNMSDANVVRNAVGGSDSSDALNVDHDEKLRKQNLDVILSYGNNFVEIVCRDTIGGHDICKMLALATLDVMCPIDKHQHWLSFMTSKGYVRHLLHSLTEDDVELQEILTPSDISLRPLYIYESKMALLTRIACTPLGARSLLQNGMLAKLSECCVFDMRPEPNTYPGQQQSEDDSFVPNLVTRYSQILFPVFKLCLAFITSLKNEEANLHVMTFLSSHSRLVSAILTNKQFTVNLVQEKALLTAILARTVEYDLSMVELDAGYLNVKAESSQFEHLMLQLLPFSIQICRSMSKDDKLNITHLEILCNVLAYCQKLMSRAGSSAKFYHVFLAPSLAEAKASNNFLSRAGANISTISVSQPSIGLIIVFLKDAADKFTKVFDEYQALVRKMNSLPELSIDELNEFINETASNEKISSQARKSMAEQKLQSLIVCRSQEIKLYSYMIESSLFILWRHLEYFLIFSHSTERLSFIQSDAGAKSRSSYANIRSLQAGARFGIEPTTETSSSMESRRYFPSSLTPDEFDGFKSDILVCIGDTLFKQLHNIEQTYGHKHSHYSFSEAILRRVKRLVQLHTTPSASSKINRN